MFLWRLSPKWFSPWGLVLITLYQFGSLCQLWFLGSESPPDSKVKILDYNYKLDLVLLSNLKKALLILEVKY